MVVFPLFFPWVHGAFELRSGYEYPGIVSGKRGMHTSLFEYISHDIYTNWWVCGTVAIAYSGREINVVRGSVKIRVAVETNVSPLKTPVKGNLWPNICNHLCNG